MILEKAVTHRAAITKWAGKGFWAVMDQGLVATSNFILNILLVRWLITIEYGDFSVAYTIFLFLGTFHSASQANLCWCLALVSTSSRLVRIYVY